MAFVFGFSNLVVANNGGTPLQKVDMTADWIVVDDGSGNTLRVPMTTTVTIDKSDASQTSTKPNYRDQAEAFPFSKWVSIWAIYNPVTNTIAGLFSLSASSPTLPSGYTHKALVGAVYSQPSTGNFQSFFQRDHRVSVAQTSLLSNGTATFPTWGSVDIPDQVPPSAKRIICDLAGTTANAGNFINQFISPVAGFFGSAGHVDNRTGSYALNVTLGIDLVTPQRMYYTNYNSQANFVTVLLNGWEF